MALRVADASGDRLEDELVIVQDLAEHEREVFRGLTDQNGSIPKLALPPGLYWVIDKRPDYFKADGGTMGRRLKFVLWIIGGIWIVAMLALSPKFVAAHRETDSVQRVFADFSAALVDQQFDIAYRFCGTDFRQVMPYEQFVKTQKDLEAQYGRIKSFKRGAYEVDGKGSPLSWRAVIDGDFAYERKTIRYEFVLRKEADRWVLYGYKQL